MKLSRSDLRRISGILRASGIENSTRETALLASHAFSLSLTKIMFSDEISCTKSEFCDFLTKVQRRAAREPVAKILGLKEFYGFEFITGSETLDPRPETELIIDLVLEYCGADEAHSILDLGAGTGCLALSLLKLFHRASVELIDISEAALEVARKNAEMLGVLKRCVFKRSEWFAEVPGGRRFDIIVSNPPYVPESARLSPEVLYDPRGALFAGRDGLDAFREIVPQLEDHLSDQGLAFLEFGFGQAEEIRALAGSLRILQVAKDLAQIDRCIVLQKGA
jgi:release factor glutamine methyltransferase